MVTNFGMETISDIISAMGGPSKMARLLGTNQSTVSEMKRRRSIPPKWWNPILETDEAQAARLTLSDIHRICTRKTAPEGEAV